MTMKFDEMEADIKASLETWKNEAGVEVDISYYREPNEPVKIPGGDALVGGREDVRSQLTRRGFTRVTSTSEAPAAESTSAK